MMCCTFCILSNKFDLKQTIRVLHKSNIYKKISLLEWSTFWGNTSRVSSWPHL